MLARRHSTERTASARRTKAFALLIDSSVARLPPAGRAWFERALQIAGLDEQGLFLAFGSACRVLGSAPLTLTPHEEGALRTAGLEWLFTGASMGEIARIALLMHAGEVVSTQEFEALVGESYRQGDAAEKRAVLRALMLLPAPERYVQLAAHGCRMSIQTVFEAICCLNPFPAAYFSEQEMNRMVLKALFTGVPLKRIIGLEERKTKELSQMAAAFASERRAAGRPVPADVERLLGFEVRKGEQA